MYIQEHICSVLVIIGFLYFLVLICKKYFKKCMMLVISITT